MACRIRSASVCAPHYAIAASLLFAMLAPGALAQTLTEPASAKRPPPSQAAKAPKAPKAAHPKSYAKACSAFGPGFINVPGTDACVKIGGWVTVEGSAQR